MAAAASSSSFCLFICIISLASFSSADPSTPIIPPSYQDLCSSFVPESTPLADSTQLHSLPSHLDISHFTGGDQLFGRRGDSFYYGEKSFRLRIRPNSHRTNSQEVFMIRASLIVRSPYPYYNDSSSDFTYGGSYVRRRRHTGVRFSLTGFWSEISRKVCMVGSANLNLGEGGTVNFTGALKMKYPSDDNPTIHDSVVIGNFESVASKNDPGWFEPVSMFAFPVVKDYKYSLVSKEIASLGSSGFPKGTSLILEPGEFCKTLSWRWIFLDLLYAVECNESRDKDCSPLGNGTAPGALSGFMNLMPLQCAEDERKIRYLARFMNDNVEDQSFSIESRLIAEGMWDDKNDQLFIAACRILDPNDHFGGAVGGCGFRLTLRYPLVWTIKDNSGVTAQLWSTGSDEDSLHFRKINLTLTSSSNANEVVGTPKLRYEYTMMERVQKWCPVKKPAKKGNTYPEAKSSDMRFDFTLQNSNGKRMYSGSASPVFVGNELYQGNRIVAWGPSSNPVIDYSGSEISATPVTNISYKISFGSYSGFNFSLQGLATNLSYSNRNYQLEVTAEGAYDSETGQVCMVGCRKLFSGNVSEDCEILVKFEFAPLNSIKGDRIKGKIASTRRKGDPLFFEDVTFSAGAYYFQMAQESLWRMDFEITVVLISNTLFCIFVSLQIFHVKRNPDVMSSISIMMVLILALGNMIPLVVNMEAIFFENHNKQTVYLSGGGWLEANEIAVRLVIMVSFLLQIRLFQLVWTAKHDESSDKSSWSGERKASFITLPLYTFGALFAFLINWARKQNGSRQNYTLWGDFRSYTGLILDGFLLPQVVLNAIRGSTEKALSHPFYMGTSALRLVPHAYNQYRAHSYPASYVNGTYYYANPAADFYSTTWDVLIPLSVIAIAVLIFLQQRRGGRCILPRRFRELELYAKVPTADTI